MGCLLGQEILCQQIDKRSVDEKTRGDGIEDTHNDESKGGVGVIGSSSDETNSLTNGGGSTKSHNKRPWLPAVLGVGDIGNTRSKTETLKHLVENNGDEQDDETLGSDGDGHAHEDRVEKNTTFNKGNLHGLLLEDHWVNSLLDVVVKVRVGLLCLGCLLLLVVGHGGHGTVDGREHLVALAHVLLVEDNEPRWHLRLGIKLVTAILGEWEVVDWVGVLLGPSTLLVLLGHGPLGIIALDAANGVVEVGLDSGGRAMSSCVESLARCATVAVTTCLLVQPHLNNKENKERAHHNYTWQGRVVVGEKIGQAWVIE